MAHIACLGSGESLETFGRVLASLSKTVVSRINFDGTDNDEKVYILGHALLIKISMAIRPRYNTHRGHLFVFVGRIRVNIRVLHLESIRRDCAPDERIVRF